MRRARKTTGRIVVSALGFGLAYYLDAENGRARRARLREALQRAVERVGSVRAAEAEGPPPVFSPLLRSIRSEGRASPLPARAEPVPAR